MVAGALFALAGVVPAQATAAAPAQAATVTPAVPCPGGNLCLYPRINFGGTPQKISGTNFHAISVKVYSFVNQRNDRFFLHLSSFGSPELCFLGSSSRNNVPNQLGSNWVNSQWAYLATTNSQPFLPG